VFLTGHGGYQPGRDVDSAYQVVLSVGEVERTSQVGETARLIETRQGARAIVRSDLGGGAGQRRDDPGPQVDGADAIQIGEIEVPLSIAHKAPRVHEVRCGPRSIHPTHTARLPGNQVEPGELGWDTNACAIGRLL